MRVRIFDIGADSSETLRGEDWLDEIVPDDEERHFAAAQINAAGRCWVGGGAAPLVMLTRAPEVPRLPFVNRNA